MNFKLAAKGMDPHFQSIDNLRRQSMPASHAASSGLVSDIETSLQKPEPEAARIHARLHKTDNKDLSLQLHEQRRSY
jgi:hypothetical protein